MSRLSFHSFPNIKRDRGKMWIAKICCLLDFTADDYISGDAIHSKRCVLKAAAIPTIFPWTTEKQTQTSITSKLAISMSEHCDIQEPVKEHKSQHCHWMMTSWIANHIMIIINQKLNVKVNSCSRKLTDYEVSLLNQKMS